MLDNSPRPRQPPRVWRDRIAIVTAMATVFAISALADIDERFHVWSAQYERYNADELLILIAGLGAVALVHFMIMRRRLRREVAIREEREAALTKALHEIEVLSGLLAMCASCKRIRDDDDRWEPVEVYLQRHGELSVSHGICPECAAQLYPDYVDASTGPVS
jgi:hypothetical protein